MFNLKILKDKRLYLLLVFLFSISYPLYNLSKKTFGVLLLLILLFSLINFNKIFNKAHHKDLVQEIVTSTLKMLLMMLILLILLGFAAQYGKSYETILIPLFCWLIILITFFWIYQNLWFFVKELKLMIVSNSNIKLKVFFCLLVIIIALIAPELAFGYGYNVMLSILYNIKFESWIETYYLSFLISYTLPIANEELLTYINKINEEKLLFTYQMFQVYSKKLTDLILIALIVGYLLDVINKTTSND